MKLLIATHNLGKFREISSYLNEFEFEILSLDDLGIQDEFEENEDSFEGNALGKARFYSDKSGHLTLADDSGLFVPALDGELGLKTRRWGAGKDATDEQWLDYFLKRMEKEEDRSARFVCAAAAVFPGLETVEFVGFGETQGLLELEPRAPLLPGLPLSSVFVPKGYDKVFAALDPEEKNAVSHRGLAFQDLLKSLTLAL